ncbi:DUF3307 domain-containing protein [Tropicimonas sp.]|uniref:DUF3307 domain-containing protein n=1 Tax=Tropicimonas sp. TaxID=2067044 RepID=UPI003A8C2AC3
MSETLAALLLAHVLADFVFQTGWIVANKRRPAALLLHMLIVFLTAIAALGLWVPVVQWALPLGALALTHLVTDAIKARLGDGPGPYVADQAVHLLTLLLIAAWRPDLWSLGHWPGLLPDPLDPWLPVAMAWSAGMILAVRAGGFAIVKLLAPYRSYWVRSRVLSGGLNDAGRLIGELERGLTFVLVVAGHPTGVAFLIAAKSLLRFNATRDDRRIAEYVIIGTLASVGWSLLVAFGIQGLVSQLLPAAP